jgi:LysR family transcriptional regulator, hydrogen peroxide-inducible genes activator
VNLVTVRGRPYSPGVGALLREAMRKKWFGNKAIALSWRSNAPSLPRVRTAAPADE